MANLFKQKFLVAITAILVLAITVFVAAPAVGAYSLKKPAKTSLKCVVFEQDAQKYMDAYDNGELDRNDMDAVKEVLSEGKFYSCGGSTYTQLYNVYYQLSQLSRDFELTRAEFAKMVVDAAGLEIVDMEGQVFSDVPEGVWYEKYVGTLYAYDIMNGYADGTFGPEDSLLRAEAVKIIVEAFELQACSYLEPVFSDVDLNYWYARSVSTAVHYGLFGDVVVGDTFNGGGVAMKLWVEDLLENAQISTEDNDPYGYYCTELGEPVTMGEMVQKLVIGAELVAPIPENPTFVNIDSDNFYYPYVEIAYANNVVHGYADGTFGVDQYITRAEASKMIVTAFDLEICDFTES